ncbi:MAG TPA: hypothetical protein VHL77_09980, partial [Ferruginibacter sp.]|nr:hypothetical protein [Ferruginibacter sp.]
MQDILKTLIRLSWLFVPTFCFSQSASLPLHYKHDRLLQRLEMLYQDNPELNISTFKPISRQLAARVANLFDSIQVTRPYDVYTKLSPIDQYNLRSLQMNNIEWTNIDPSRFKSKKLLWNALYKTPADFFSVNEPDFFLAINPVLQLQQSFQTGNSERLFLNSKGLTLRGLIGKKIGFDAYITDNQERGPDFFQQRVKSFDAVPGAGFYKSFKTTAFDYLDARGSMYFGAGKYFKFQFGYDKNFIGNGYRSLLLSDFGNSYLFFRVNTSIWKIQYNNLFMELVPQTVQISAGNKILDKKYAAIHHLSINATRWLNVGLFEAVIFGRKNHFEFSYLNPIIFLRGAEQQNGSADNAIIGLDFKANAGHQGQFYGQFVLDEFVLKEVRSGNGWWGNKYAVQFGTKYIDAFEFKNFDIQAEVNLARPFTYSHFDSVANYTHYNQPLAHPLGANFIEGIFLAYYQPKPKWTTQFRFVIWNQGVDSVNSNFGGNIFKPNGSRN